MSNLTVVTYGGGDVLLHIFNAIAMLMGRGEHGIIWPIAIITASFGGIWALSKAFFSSRIEAFLTHYIFPIMAIPCLLMIPTASVKIEDVLKNTSYKVDHVPLFFAKAVELTSTIGYRLTQGIEKVMHVPNDVSYNKTGMLFGAETSLDISKFKVTNATLEQNLSKFAKQCILYDLALGRYSLDDLKKTTDLWGFLEEHTSKVGMIHYFDPKAQDESGGEYISCRHVLPRIETLFEKEKDYYSQHELLKHLPLTFQVLTGIQKDNEDLINQQIMMSSLSNGLTSANLAKLRAEAQQKSTYQVMGSIASSSLISMRVVLEALIYASFLIVIPLALIPGGIKFIFSWLWLCVWIQLWPPFYAILNYIMQLTAVKYSATIMFGLSEEEKGLSLFTSQGLQNLHENISATAGYLSLSIPFISYTILQGAQSFVHLAGTLASPAQSAATGAAIEAASGNYSLANTNFGQMSYANTSALQSNTAPSLSSGFMTEHHGSYSEIHTPNGSIISQHPSVLTTRLSSDEAISQHLQNSMQTAQTQTSSTQQSYTDSLSRHARAVQDLTKHYGSSTSYSESISERDSNSIQQSCGWMNNTVENFARTHNLSTNEAYDLLVTGGVSGSIGFKFFGNGGSWNGGATNNTTNSVVSSSALSHASNLTASEDFQKHFNNISEFAKNNAHSSTSDEGVKLASGFCESLDTVKSSQDSYQNALNDMHQASQNLSWSQNNSHQIRRSLDQDFVTWSIDQIGRRETINMLENPSHTKCDQMMSEFMSSYVCKLREGSELSLKGYQDPQMAFEKGAPTRIDHAAALSDLKARGASQEQEYGFSKGMHESKKECLEKECNDGQFWANNHFETKKTEHASAHSSIKADLELEKQRSRFGRMLNCFLPESSSSGSVHTVESESAPLWLQN